jgi:transaldolase
MNNEEKQTEIPKETLEGVMKELSDTVNPKSSREGNALLAIAEVTNNPSIILKPMEEAAVEFKEKTGRQMTY